MMYHNEYTTVLQLSPGYSRGQLDAAHRASRERFLRLTRGGLLRNYRRELLAEADRAWRRLSGSRSISDRPGGHVPGNLPEKPWSLLSRRAYRRPELFTKAPVRGGQSLHGGESGFSRAAGLVETIDAESRRVADQKLERFARHVIYRLDGDLIRYSARLELLSLARDWKIPLFQANLIIARVCQAVRGALCH